MKFKFNFIDVLILLLVLGAAVFAAQRLPRGAAGAEQVNIVYKVHLAAVENPIHERIKVGDTIFISAKEKDTAVVKEVSAKPAEVMAYDSIKGEYRNVPAPDKWDIVLTLQSKGTETGGSVTAGSTTIRVGEELFPRGKGYAGRGFVIDVETYTE